jgi:hypothetical protein
MAAVAAVDDEQPGCAPSPPPKKVAVCDPEAEEKKYFRFGDLPTALGCHILGFTEVVVMTHRRVSRAWEKMLGEAPLTLVVAPERHSLWPVTLYRPYKLTLSVLWPIGMRIIHHAEFQWATSRLAHLTVHQICWIELGDLIQAVPSIRHVTFGVGPHAQLGKHEIPALDKIHSVLARRKGSSLNGVKEPSTCVRCGIKWFIKRGQPCSRGVICMRPLVDMCEICNAIGSMAVHMLDCTRREPPPAPIVHTSTGCNERELTQADHTMYSQFTNRCRRCHPLEAYRIACGSG